MPQIDVEHLTPKERIALITACELVIDALDSNRESH